MNGREARGRLKDKEVPLTWVGVGLWNRRSWVHIPPPPPVGPVQTRVTVPKVLLCRGLT